MPSESGQLEYDDGVCALCHTAPVVEDDVLCAPCRQLVYESSEVVTDPLERLIGEHRLSYFMLQFDEAICGCGKKWKGGAGYHRHHLAEVICDFLGLDPPTPWMPAPEYDRLHPEETADVR